MVLLNGTGFDSFNTSCSNVQCKKKYSGRSHPDPAYIVAPPNLVSTGTSRPPTSPFQRPPSLSLSCTNFPVHPPQTNGQKSNSSRSSHTFSPRAQDSVFCSETSSIQDTADAYLQPDISALRLKAVHHSRDPRKLRL